MQYALSSEATLYVNLWMDPILNLYKLLMVLMQTNATSIEF